MNGSPFRLQTRRRAHRLLRLSPREPSRHCDFEHDECFQTATTAPGSAPLSLPWQVHLRVATLLVLAVLIGDFNGHWLATCDI